MPAWYHPCRRFLLNEEYPDNDTIHIVDNELTYNGHVNTFTNEFMTHIRTMDESLYSGYVTSCMIKVVDQEPGLIYFIQDKLKTSLDIKSCQE